MMHINWWTWSDHAPPMGWFLVDFALFVAGLMFWAGRPIAASLRERHVSIKRAIADAAAAHAKASQAQHEARQKLAGLEAEIRELLQTTAVDGEAERAQMVHDAEAYATRMRADVQSMADQELKRARLRLQARTLQAALVRAETLLLSELGSDDQQQQLEASIDAMGDAAQWQTRRPHHAAAARPAQEAT
jgi:F0F1-type ATP synthase membrane subunit b/b'